ncbi:ATP-binding protein [Cryptosporangium sp. NPDC051539]|uniref:ATP-binding protein n=1 Tax=Cryptosporangium sp. NPDC051539 TaxID=3363962 RepID=UPI0037B185FF
MVRRVPRFATQVLLLQVAILLLVVGAGSALVAVLLRRTLEHQYEARALAIAQSVASDPSIASHVAAHDPARVQALADDVRRRTGALFVVITDDRGIRYSHTDPERIGERVSTDPSGPLSGREVVAVERGTLGLSARGKVPLYAGPGRTIVGEVSVGIALTEVTQATAVLFRTAGIVTGVALLAGILGAVALAQRLRRQTLGLEPTDLADLLREREAVMHGIAEGVVAVDRADRITVCNGAAADLLGGPIAPGTPLEAASLPPRLRTLLSTTDAHGALVVAGERLLVVTAGPVQHGHQDLGRVVTLRDRTEADALSRELDMVRTLSDALRAQSHEHTNRLHTLAGLLHIGEDEEARSYLGELNGSTDPDGRVRDPYLRGVLSAKTVVAAEAGVALRLSDETYLPARLHAPLDVITVLGNLVDNAVRAARLGHRQPAWVELTVVSEQDTLRMVTVDSGDGVPAQASELVFEDGYTTAGADRDRPHGLGLVLARRAARRHGGDVVLARAAGLDCGAVFEARLPGVVEVP